VWEEYELKLALTPEDVPRLSRNPLVRSLASRRAKTKHLHSTYFDTDSHDLRRRGMALRVRQVGAETDENHKTVSSPHCTLRSPRKRLHSTESGSLRDGSPNATS